MELFQGPSQCNVHVSFEALSAILPINAPSSSARGRLVHHTCSLSLRGVRMPGEGLSVIQSMSPARSREFKTHTWFYKKKLK